MKSPLAPLGLFLVRLLIVVFLLSPFAIWLIRLYEAGRMGSILAIGTPAISRAIGDSLLLSTVQAGASAFLSLVLGGMAGLALISIRDPRLRGWIEAVLLFPQFLPVLFVVVAVFSLTQWFGVFPQGIVPVIGVHVLLNLGLVAVALGRRIRTSFAGMGELAWLEGARRIAFWRAVWGAGLRDDAALLFLLVFSLSWASFSVPLVLGGARALTFELLIYQMILWEGAWGVAWLLSVIQSALMITFAFLLLYRTASLTELKGQAQREAIPWGVPLGLPSIYLGPAVLGFLFLGLVPLVTIIKGLFASSSAWSLLVHSKSTLISGLVGTVVVGVATALSVGFLLLATLAALPARWFEHFLSGFIAPSLVLTGLAWVFVGATDRWGMILGLTLVTVPVLFRYVGRSTWLRLQGQMEVARVLGAGWAQRVVRIFFPQVVEPVARASALAAVWAAGDYGLSGLVASEDSTLALQAITFLSSYHVDVANLLSVACVLIGGVLYFAFVYLGSYLRQWVEH